MFFLSSMLMYCLFLCKLLCTRCSGISVFFYYGFLLCNNKNKNKNNKNKNKNKNKNNEI